MLDYTHFEGGLVFRSTDDGDHWTKVSTGLTNAFVLAFASNAIGDLFAGSIALRVYVDKPPPNQWFFHGGLFHSADSGNQWSRIGFKDTTVSSIAINSDGDIFVGTYGYGVFRSKDNGKTLTEINSDLSSIYERNIRSLTINTDGHIFAATLAGVFGSSDNGDHWIRVNGGLTDTAVYAIAVDPNGFVYAGTDNGVHRSVHSTTAVKRIAEDISTSFSLSQSYPNPFNLNTVIQISLPHPAS